MIRVVWLNLILHDLLVKFAKGILQKTHAVKPSDVLTITEFVGVDFGVFLP